MWRQPVYVLLLILLPVLGCAVSAAGHKEMSGAAVAVCVEEGPWAASVADGLRAGEADSVLVYVFCNNAAAVQRLVLTGEADCGFVISADIEERVMTGDWQKSVTVYETADSSIAGMAEERIAGVIFRLYSEQRYGEYMERYSDGAAEYAGEAYEKHLTDGSTFGFRYLYYDEDAPRAGENGVSAGQETFPLKGVLAIVIFIGGMCGLLEYDTDIREKRFLRLAPRSLTCIVDIWLPTVFLSLAALICMWLSDVVRAAVGQAGGGAAIGVWSAGMWLAEAGRLIVYQGIVVLYCLVLRMLLRRRETIAAAIPLFSLASLVCAPVFVRLGAYVPVFAVLERLFPVTYYLRM